MYYPVRPNAAEPKEKGEEKERQEGRDETENRRKKTPQSDTQTLEV